MSDYLWDKTGEPDAEVERLEKLLGTLAHRPRALELPPAARVAHAPRRGVTRPAMAFAAALALLLLAGGWLFASRRANHRQAAQSSSQTPAARGDERERKDANTAENNFKNEAPAPVVVRQSETAGDKNRAVGLEPQAGDAAPRRESGRQPSRQQSAQAVRRRRDAVAVQSNAGSGKTARTVEARGEPPEEGLLAVVMGRQRSAKEQLVYGLRLTGAKLSEVQTKVRGAPDGRAAPGERNRIR